VIGKANQSHGPCPVRVRSAGQTKKQFIARLDGTKITGVDPQGQIPAAQAGYRRTWSSIPPAYERPAPAVAEQGAGDQSTPHVVVTFTQRRSAALSSILERSAKLFVVDGANMAEEAPELMTLGVDPGRGADLRGRSSLGSCFAHTDEAQGIS